MLFTGRHRTPVAAVDQTEAPAESRASDMPLMATLQLVSALSDPDRDCRLLISTARAEPPTIKYLPLNAAAQFTDIVKEARCVDSQRRQLDLERSCCDAVVCSPFLHVLPVQLKDTEPLTICGEWIWRLQCVPTTVFFLPNTFSGFTLNVSIT